MEAPDRSRDRNTRPVRRCLNHVLQTEIFVDTKLTDIETRIAGLLENYLESSGHPELEAHDEVSAATNLVSDFTMDSFQVMEFLMEIEESFDIMIDMNSLSNAHTVSDLAKVVVATLAD
jgi:acyl carrier protein